MYWCKVLSWHIWSLQPPSTAALVASVTLFRGPMSSMQVEMSSTIIPGFSFNCFFDHTAGHLSNLRWAAEPWEISSSITMPRSLLVWWELIALAMLLGLLGPPWQLRDTEEISVHAEHVNRSDGQHSRWIGRATPWFGREPLCGQFAAASLINIRLSALGQMDYK